MLTLVRKDEEQWWTVSNAYGRTGLVPVPYIEPVMCFILLLVITSYCLLKLLYLLTICDDYCLIIVLVAVKTNHL